MRQAAVLSRGRSLSTARTGPVLRSAWLAVAVVALLIAVAGTGILVRRLAASGPPTNTATLGGLTASLGDAGWLSMDGHDMNNQGGYQMPSQMMPGAPAGDDMRFGVPLTLVNTSDKPRQFNLPEEFFLHGGRNTLPRPLHSDTFGRLPRLTPGNAIDGTIYFDTVVPGPGDPPLYLQWERDGDTAILAIPLLGQAPHGGHG